MYGRMLRAGTLALAVTAFAVPGFAQTNTAPRDSSGVPKPTGTDVPTTNPANNPADRATTGGTAGSSATQSPGVTDSGGATIPGSQPGAQPGTVETTPGGSSGAPANPCTPALKAQNRC